MTGAEHIAQRELVAASLLADEQREHHHDVYSPRRRAATPGGHRGDDYPESAGAALDPAHECPACRGAGEIGFNPGYPDPQRADSMPCGDCRGTGVAPRHDGCT
jgi:hypothetical protein